MNENYVISYSPLCHPLSSVEHKRRDFKKSQWGFFVHTMEVNGQQSLKYLLLSYKVSLFCETVCHVDLAHYLSWSFWLWRAIHWGQSAETFWLWVFNISQPWTNLSPLSFLLISDKSPEKSEMHQKLLRYLLFRKGLVNS